MPESLGSGHRPPTDKEVRIVVGDPPMAPVKNRIPVEATMTDIDGINVNILLPVVDGRVNELDVYRDDSGSVRGELLPERVTVYADYG